MEQGGGRGGLGGGPRSGGVLIPNIGFDVVLGPELKSQSIYRLLLTLNLLEKPPKVPLGLSELTVVYSTPERRNFTVYPVLWTRLVTLVRFGGFSVDHIFKNGLLLNFSLSSRYPQNRQAATSPPKHTRSAAVVVGGGGVVLKF